MWPRASQKPELSAGPPFQGKSSWIFLLLTGSIFSTCFLMTQAEDISIAIFLHPQYPDLGEDVTFIPEGNMEDVLSCCWFRGVIAIENRIVIYRTSANGTQHFKDAYTGRETVDRNCSLHITNLTLLDTGYYIIRKEKNVPQANEQGKKFLLIREKSGNSKQSKVLSAKITAGIVMSCLSAFLAVVGLISYQTLKAYERIEPAETATILT